MRAREVAARADGPLGDAEKLQYKARYHAGRASGTYLHSPRTQAIQPLLSFRPWLAQMACSPVSGERRLKSADLRLRHFLLDQLFTEAAPTDSEL